VKLLNQILNEDIIARIAEQIRIVIRIDKTSHAAERQDREDEHISDEEIINTAKRGLKTVVEYLIFDKLDLNHPFVISSKSNNLNIVSNLQQRGDNIDLIVITVMRKKHFMPKAGTKQIIVEDWWEDATPEQQKKYVEEHPKSKKAIEYKKEKGQEKNSIPTQERVVVDLRRKPYSKTKQFLSNYYPSEKEEKNYLKKCDELKKQFSESSHLFAALQTDKNTKEAINDWKGKGVWRTLNDPLTSKKEKERLKKQIEILSDIASKDSFKIDYSLERGMIIPTTDIDSYLQNFNQGQEISLPPSGFSGNPKSARTFAQIEKNDKERVSVVIKLHPNSKGMMRGSYIDVSETSLFSKENEIVRSHKSKSTVDKIEDTITQDGARYITIHLKEQDF